MRLDLDEALRYLGAKGSLTPEWRSEAEKMGQLAISSVRPSARSRYFPLKRTENGFELQGSGIVLTGRSAEKMLRDCEAAALMVCTLGHGFDALVRQWQRRDMSRAVLLDACGSALVETLCDDEQEKLAAAHSGLYMTDRFSPGYGDLPLALQPSILSALDASRAAGVTLSESLLMVPSKSVTAVIGFSFQPQRAVIRGCAYCLMRGQCAYRKGGQRCEADKTPSA